MFIQYFELNLHGVCVCVYLHKLPSYQLQLLIRSCGCGFWKEGIT